MLTLKSIYLRNWARVKESWLTFPECGLVRVLGNYGVGKTALGEAISRTLLGVEGRCANLGWYSRDENGDTYVRLEATLDHQPLVVELGYKCGELSRTGEGLRFRLGNNLSVERGHVRETRQELAALLIPSELAEWTVYLDGEKLKFNRLTQAETVNLLMQALAQPPWEKFHERAKGRLSSVATAKTQADARHHAAQRAVEDAGTTLEAAHKTHRAAVEEHAGHTQRYAASQAEFSANLAHLEAEVAVASDAHANVQRRIRAALTAPDLQGYESQISTVHVNLNQARENLAEWQDERRQRQRLARELSERRDTLASPPRTCRTCGQTLTLTVNQTEVVEVEAKLAAAATDVTDAETQCAALEKYSRETEVHLRQLKLAQADAKAKLTAADVAEETRYQATLANLQRQLARLKAEAPVAPSSAAVDRAEGRLRSVEEAVAQATARLAEAATARATAERASLVTAYWAAAFSPTGIPNLVLTRAVKPLNDAARLLSQSLSQGVLQVSFETAVELASGDARPRVNVRVLNSQGASRVTCNSKGENGIANLIIAETQAELGQVTRKVGYRWLDEAVNSQDPAVRRSVYSYLRRQAAERRALIFAVDHNTEVAEFADHVLLTERDADGFTRYRWA